MSFLAIQRRLRPLLIFLRGFRVACLASRAKEHRDRDRDRACSITFDRPFAITRRSSRTELIVTRVRVRHREDDEPSRQREVFAGNIRARTRGYDRPYRPRANRRATRSQYAALASLSLPLFRKPLILRSLSEIEARRYRSTRARWPLVRFIETRAPFWRIVSQKN